MMSLSQAEPGKASVSTDSQSLGNDSGVEAGRVCVCVCVCVRARSGSGKFHHFLGVQSQRGQVREGGTRAKECCWL